MSGFQLAQINIARFRAPVDHPNNANFMNALDAVNAFAEASDGFIWRLVGDGNNATDVEVDPDDSQLIVNMSVWRDVDALGAFVYRQPDHLGVMRRRKEWFDTIATYQVLWWVPIGHRPSVAEGLEKLALLAKMGPSADAFTFRVPFAAPDGMPAHPILDECA
jgi:Domain of unknown function (DUF3291)